MIPPWMIEEFVKEEQRRREQQRPVAELPCMESLYDETGEEEQAGSQRGVEIMDISPTPGNEYEI